MATCKNGVLWLVAVAAWSGEARYVNRLFAHFASLFVEKPVMFRRVFLFSLDPDHVAECAASGSWLRQQ